MVGSCGEFECVEADAMQSFVVDEERFVTVDDQVTGAEHGVVRLHDHLRYLAYTCVAALHSFASVHKTS